MFLPIFVMENKNTPHKIYVQKFYLNELIIPNKTSKGNLNVWKVVYATCDTVVQCPFSAGSVFRRLRVNLNSVIPTGNSWQWDTILTSWWHTISSFQGYLMLITSHLSWCHSPVFRCNYKWHSLACRMILWYTLKGHTCVLALEDFLGSFSRDFFLEPAY